MKKICSKCGALLDDATQEDRICPQCGGTLNALPAEARGDITPQRQMSVDNRIHKGDNIGAIHQGNEMNVAGDNAESIDKSTSITTNNTTNTTTNNTSNVTNIIQAKDEGMELVRCEMSGKNVRKIETFQCNVCHRTIYQAFFSNDFKCCEECAQKQRRALGAEQRRLNEERQRQMAEQQRREQQRKEELQRLEQQRRQALQANKPEPQHISTSASSTPQHSYHNTTRQETEQTNSSHKFLWTVVFLLVVGGGYYLWAGRSNSERITPNVEQQETADATPEADASAPSPSDAKTEIKATAQPTTASTAANTGTEAPKATEEAPKTEAASSPWAEGEKAYKNGEYSKAKVYLQQAADGGKAMANYYLAQMYENGKGVSPDQRKAFSYMKKAAEGGCAKAYFPLAEMLRNGDGTEANRAQAKKWYERTVTSDRAHADMAAEILETYE